MVMPWQRETKSKSKGKGKGKDKSKSMISIHMRCDVSNVTVNGGSIMYCNEFVYALSHHVHVIWCSVTLYYKFISLIQFVIPTLNIFVIHMFVLLNVLSGMGLPLNFEPR